MSGGKFPSDITFLNVNGRRYVGKVVPEQIYVGSLFRNSNVNTALVRLKPYNPGMEKRANVHTVQSVLICPDEIKEHVV